MQSLKWIYDQNFSRTSFKILKTNCSMFANSEVVINYFLWFFITLLLCLDGSAVC